MNRRVNLTFHGVGDPTREVPPAERDVWIGAERLEAILDNVQHRNHVWLSFDDGNDSDVRHGLPALRQRGLQATFFVVAGKLGTPGFLTEEDILRLIEAGMKVGSHGMHHTPWRRLDDEQLREELLQSKRILEDIANQPVQEAACPFGAYDRRVLSALHAYGYRRVFTSDGGLARPDRWLQPRNSVTVRNESDPFEHAGGRDRPISRAALRRLKLAVKRWR